MVTGTVSIDRIKHIHIQLRPLSYKKSRGEKKVIFKVRLVSIQDDKSHFRLGASLQATPTEGESLVHRGEAGAEVRVWLMRLLFIGVLGSPSSSSS